MKTFIAENNLIKRLGFPEWYSPDNKTRLVKIGDRYRMDIRRKNWSTFRSDYIVGHREREFKAGQHHRRY
jgi:hypothetical protein